MAVVLTAVGAVLYLSVREALDGQIAENAVDRIEASEERDETLATLLTLLLVVGPVALLLASLAGYLLAGAALRPVEAMRRGAAEISAATSGRRLPLPPAHDEVRRLGETLNAMLGRLEEGLERERRFVADAGHELRTPLATLRAELELALRQPRPPEELVAALRSAAEEVERLVRLAEDLLVLAREGEERAAAPAHACRRPRPARGGRGPLPARRPVDRGGGAGGSRARRRPRAPGAGARESRRECSAPRPRRRPAPGRAGEGEVVFRVQDEGPGFPPGFADRAFERFSRADEARTGGGAGLGLAIVAAVARAHGGRVSVAGAEVTLAIPSSSCCTGAARRRARAHRRRRRRRRDPAAARPGRGRLRQPAAE